MNVNKSIISTNSITLLGHNIQNNKISPDPDRLKPLLEMPPPVTLKSQKRVVGMFSYYSKFIKNFSDKIRPLNNNIKFPLPPPAIEAFNKLKDDVRDATLITADHTKEFEVETDASQFCIAATLNQGGRPVAFFSRTLNPSEVRHHAVEKEAAAIVEAIRKWRHFLLGRHFKIITDQKSISFMFDNGRKSKIKNDKICRWRIELSQYKFSISYRPGAENVAADTFSRVAAISHSLQDLRQLHNQLCHPGTTRFFHFVKARNLPYSLEQVKGVTKSCSSCQYLKPTFLSKDNGTLIKAILPFQRINIDFKGPLPSSPRGNKYLLTIIDEYSRFPFAFPCKDMTSKTIIHCLNQLFSIFGMPDMIHSDRATDFLSEELRKYLREKGIATSKTSRYHPEGNGQVEKLNGTLWKAIQVTLHARNMNTQYWENVLPDALHSIRSLLCTATNMTPHDRLFKYSRKSTSGTSIPTWVKPGPIYIRNHSRISKNDPLVTPATLLEINPHYAHIRLPSGVETTVSVQDIAPNNAQEEDSHGEDTHEVHCPDERETNDSTDDANENHPQETQNVRRSSRAHRVPEKYKDFVTELSPNNN